MLHENVRNVATLHSFVISCYLVTSAIIEEEIIQKTEIASDFHK